MGGEIPMKRVNGYWVLVAALVLSIATLTFVSFAPIIMSVEETGHVNMTTEGDVEERPIERHSKVRRVTLPEAQGWGAVLSVAGPLLVLTGLPLLARTRRGAIVLRGASTIVLAAGVFLGVFSFGIFYLPPAMLLLVATVMASRSS